MRARSGADLSGLLLLDKPAGCTSHDVVKIARRALRQRKIGHCGTLDPDATGLLVLTLGKATRLTRFLINAPKTYSGVMRFGISTDTYDASGEVVEELPSDGLTSDQVRAAANAMVGTMDQAAPPYSAKKVKGVKASDIPGVYDHLTIAQVLYELIGLFLFERGAAFIFKNPGRFPGNNTELAVSGGITVLQA